MIPVMIVPILNRPELLGRMLRSVDVPVERLYLVDNGDVVGDEWAFDDVHVCRPGANLGVAASWNLGVKANLDARWWAFVNVDIVFAPGALEALARAVERRSPSVATLYGFGAFALDAAAVDEVGFFDESFHPIYFEDSDWDYRAKLKGLEVEHVYSETRHDSETTIRSDERLAGLNRMTYAVNRSRYEQKWGRGQAGLETFSTPFDDGSDPAETKAPRLALLRSQAWR